MKKLILSSAVLLAMTACSDSDSTSGNGNEYSCNVSRKGNSVEIDQSYKDERAQEIVTLVSGDDFMTVTNKKTFPKESYAQEDCELMKEFPLAESLECNGKTVELTYNFEKIDLDEAEKSYEKRCSDFYKSVENGEMEKEYQKNYGK